MGRERGLEEEEEEDEEEVGDFFRRKFSTSLRNATTR